MSWNKIFNNPVKRKPPVCKACGTLEECWDDECSQCPFCSTLGAVLAQLEDVPKERAIKALKAALAEQKKRS